MSPRHSYGESLCQRKSFFSLWFLCFFAVKLYPSPNLPLCCFCAREPEPRESVDFENGVLAS